ncbi:MAG: pseudouridine synthase [Candidatus Latescibacteria bacterium]|nr:pseudouridine synthase [bacterium]MBD3425109.1 pseudouridine synthase [Candidatus Latescibacterota bacterium]
MNERMIRINRYLAGSGLGSRRKCEKYVLEGKVRVNGKEISDLAFKVNPGKDDVTVCGERVFYNEKSTVLVMNKPAGIVCSVSDELGRRTVIDLTREKGYNQRLFPVGRLDMDTTGILLITNDGKLTNRMIHPRYHVKKVYRVRVQGNISGSTVSTLESGVDIGGYITSPCSVRIIESGRGYTELEIAISEGKKRQIKRMFLSCGHPVIKLHRKSIGGLSFKDLDTGEVRPLSRDEERLLRKRIGLD